MVLLPIAVDGDHPGREIKGPKAAVIIGGLIASNVMTLLMLPSVSGDMDGLWGSSFWVAPAH